MISGIRVRPLRALVIALLALAATTDAVALFGRDLLMEPCPSARHAF